MPGREREEIVGEARRERGRGECEGGAGCRARRRGGRRLVTARPRRPACWACWAAGLGWVGDWTRSGTWSAWFSPRAPRLSLWSVHSQYQWETKRNRSLKQGGWPVTPRGVCGTPSFLWGDASSAQRRPGSRGCEPVRRSLVRASGCLCHQSSQPCSYCLSCLSFGYKRKKGKTSWRTGCQPGQDIYTWQLPQCAI